METLMNADLRRIEIVSLSRRVDERYQSLAGTRRLGVLALAFSPKKTRSSSSWLKKFKEKNYVRSKSAHRRSTSEWKSLLSWAMRSRSVLDVCVNW